MDRRGLPQVAAIEQARKAFLPGEMRDRCRGEITSGLYGSLFARPTPSENQMAGVLQTAGG